MFRDLAGSDRADAIAYDLRVLVPPWDGDAYEDANSAANEFDDGHVDQHAQPHANAIPTST
jgi:hypothetical protein